MDRARLVAYLDEGMSLDQIGAVENRHPSTIGYWLKKLGLEANGRAKHSPRGGVEREQLAELVERGLTLREIAQDLDVSATTVRYWIKRYGLRAPLRVRRSAIEQALAEGQRTLLKECGQHGWTTFVIENSGRTRCRQCRMAAVSAWRRRSKAKLVEEAGGCCVLCGYSKYPGALHFHHTNPAEKTFELSNAGAPRAIEALRAEAAKCVLLCGNCHAEVEAGFTKL